MFYSLPTEIQLDILKCLNYKKLCSIKQTNLYFRDFINYFEGKLAREDLFGIFLDDIVEFNENFPHKLFKHEAGNFDFPLNDQLEEKWKNGLEKPIPLYLAEQDLNKNIIICLCKVYPIQYHLRYQLPTIIKNKNDIEIVYYYLNKLFNCSFQRGYFREFIFNPELIQLLFGPKQFYIQTCLLVITDNNIENLFQFALNHLISKTLDINFGMDYGKTTENCRDTLFKILTSRGDNFKNVNVHLFDSLKMVNFAENVKMLYEHIVEYIATSRDCSKLVAVITVRFTYPTIFELSKRAEKVEIKQYSVFNNERKDTKYQIANIHNPEVRFSFLTEESEGLGTSQVKLKIMKG
uniref:Uncharacterized protein n=1 Tax=Meloidogyne enterolobii TaxID=390850 RepID=A0A6V7VT89_MELEN|nr:unnamed protein product [Meloidogyne enterolobii]